MSKTLLKLEACGHTIRVRDWGGSPHRAELSLDGFYLAVLPFEKRSLLLAMAEKLAFALRAPSRKKPRPV